jgi:polysaccharide biosynthesis transport protein
MSIQEYTSADYMTAFRRRSGIFGLAFAAVLALAVGAALLLPDVYRSTAEIRVDLEGNVELLEPVALTTYADHYVKSLEQRALSYNNLRGWLEELDLYAGDRRGETESALVSRMRGDIRVAMVTTTVVDPRSGRGMELITGFTVGFESSDPEVSHAMTSRMADAFLAEDRAIRTQRAATASEFLREQIAEEQERIIMLEERIAEFKETNAGAIPEMMGANMAALERTERDLEQVRAEIEAIDQDRIFRQTQLEEIRRTSGSATRLAALEEEYMRAVSLYGPDHPDVRRISRQVAALTGEGGIADGPSEVLLLEARLAEALERYSDLHPDVVSLRRQLAAAREQERPRPTGVDYESDPAYLQLRAQINAADRRLEGLRQRATQLQSRYDTMQDRMDRMPQVEREYTALNRDLQTAQLAFDDLRRRLAQARQTESFEAGERGARLEMVRSPSVPENPAWPPRLGIAFLGIFLAATVAGGTALAREGLDSTIRGAIDIRTMLHTQPIVAVPIVQNSLSQSLRRRMVILTLVGIVALAAVLMAAYAVGGR